MGCVAVGWCGACARVWEVRRAGSIGLEAKILPLTEQRCRWPSKGTGHNSETGGDHIRG